MRYELISVLTLETKSESIRRIHFTQKLIDEYKENLKADDLRKKICADALIYAIEESGYKMAYLRTFPTEENVKHALSNRIPSFFDELDEPLEQELIEDMKDEAHVYKNKAEKSYYIHDTLVCYFDKEMVDLYNRLYTKLMDCFEKAEIRKDDWNNYSLL